MNCKKRQAGEKYEDLRTPEQAKSDATATAVELAKHISGEATASLVSREQQTRTHTVTELLLQTQRPLEAQLDRLDAELADHKRDIAALKADILASKPRGERESVRDPESIETGDTFRWIGGDRDGSICEVVSTYGDTAKIACPASRGLGAVVYQFDRLTLLDPTEFERVRAVEAAPRCADTLDPMARCELPTGHAGVHRCGAWSWDDEGYAHDGPLPASPRPVSPLVEFNEAPTTEGATSDLDGPAGDERIGLTASGEAALWAADVANLLAAWRSHPALAVGYADVDERIDALRARASLPPHEPCTRDTTPAVHRRSDDENRSLCGVHLLEPGASTTEAWAVSCYMCRDAQSRVSA